jgi:hypothetical protein
MNLYTFKQINTFGFNFQEPKSGAMCLVGGFHDLTLVILVGVSLLVGVVLLLVGARSFSFVGYSEDNNLEIV